MVRRGKSVALVHDTELRKLIETGHPARVSDHLAGQPVQWLIPRTEKEFQEAAFANGPLDRERSALGRVEQSFLRSKIFGEQQESMCSLCARQLPVELLIAAHIKPRSECSRSERLDWKNIVFGVCLLGCDALYERGLLGVGPRGRICVSDTPASQILARVLRSYRGRKCEPWKVEAAGYFDWHLRFQFQGRRR
jgi:hypothetical protein